MKEKQDYDKTIGVFSEESNSIKQITNKKKKKQFGEEARKEKPKKKEKIEESLTIESLAFSDEKEITTEEIEALKKEMKEERKWKPIWLLKALIISILIVITVELLAYSTVGHGSHKDGLLMIFIDSYISILVANFIGDKRKWNRWIRIIVSIVCFIIGLLITEFLLRKFQ